MTLTTWDSAVTAWGTVLRAAGRSRHTIALRAYHVRYMGEQLGRGPWELSTDDLLGWLGSRDWSRNTRRSWVASIRGFYAWAFSAELIEVDPAAPLPTVQASAPRPKPATESAYRAALGQARATGDGRVVLMLRLAAEAGLRRGEVARVHAGDLVEDLGGWSLIVHGKGDKQRTVPLTDDLAGAVRRQTRGGWAFPGGVGGHLGAERVGKLVADALGSSMHTLRHRFATVAYGVDRDLLVVQGLLGHASPETTRAYVQLPADAARRHVVAVAAA